MAEHAIEVENLSKSYRLGEVGAGSLKEDLSRWWRRLRGRGEPRLSEKLVKLSEQYGDRVEGRTFHALRDISFTVPQGQVLGIIGANGAGKSTLLKILSRITEPTDGRALMRGRLSSLLEVGTGFHPDLTGRENVYLNGAIMGLKRIEVSERLDRIIEFAGIHAFLDTPVKRYSSGMNVRLGFAVAAHLEPDILIVDEVLAVGDAGFQERCLTRMDEVARGGRTIIFVSHQMHMISQLCQRVIMIQDGKITLDGGPREVVREYFKAVNAGAAERRGFVTVSPKSKPEQQALLSEGCLVAGSAGNGRVAYGEPLRFRFTIHANRDCPDLAIWIAIDNQARQAVAVCNTYDGQMKLALQEGETMIAEASLDGLYLHPGRYYVSASMSSHNAVADFLPTFSFEVLVDSYDESMQWFERGGSLTIKADWQTV